MSVTDEVKTQLDIVDLINDYVSLEKSGRNYKALCPFHTENTPSFVVFPETQTWRCFGACSEGGDIFTFMMKHEGWDFPEALRHLADRAGVQLQPMSPQQQQAREEWDRLRDALEEAAAFYHRLLLSSPNAEFAYQYIVDRGLTDDTIDSFQLGYAPNSWDATMNFLLEQGFERDDLVNAGLLVVKDDGSVYDRFRNRLMIPIFDVRGRVVGFGARALAKDAQPKYLNSPQSEVFDKSQVLYGLSHARRTVRETETVVITEGYMDVMQAHQAGFTDVVAEMGTALTEGQFKLLSRYASRLILALDPDAAGQMATERGREVIERVSKAAAEQVEEDGVWDFDSVEREYQAKLTTEFDARGILRYESRLGFDIRVVVLPAGQDPDDLIREDPEYWAQLIDSAIPIVEYVIQKTTEDVDLDDPKVKSRVADEIVPLIEDIPNPVERSHYIQRLTRLLKVPESTLFPRGTVESRPRRQPARRDPPRDPLPHHQDSAPRLTDSPTRSREAFCLAALLRHPRLVYRVNRILARYLAPEQLAGTLPDEMAPDAEPRADVLTWWVIPEDFSIPEHRNIFSTWMSALDQEDQSAFEQLINYLDEESAQVVRNLLDRPLYALMRQVTVPTAEPSEDRIFEEVVRGLLNLRKSRLDESLRSLAYLLEDEVDGGGSLSAAAHGETIKTLMVARARVEKALGKYGEGGKRVGDDQHQRVRTRTQ